MKRKPVCKMEDGNGCPNKVDPQHNNCGNFYSCADELFLHKSAGPIPEAGSIKHILHVCSIHFRSSTSLEGHTRVHTVAKPNRCMEFNKTFLLKMHLTKHKDSYRCEAL